MVPAVVHTASSRLWNAHLLLRLGQSMLQSQFHSLLSELSRDLQRNIIKAQWNLLLSSSSTALYDADPSNNIIKT
jgi:hypothetical protein